MNQVNIDKTLRAIESGLNVAGYIPFVSTASGAIRVGQCKTEAVGSAAIAGVLLVNPCLKKGQPV